MSKQIELHINLSTVLNHIEDDDLVAEVRNRRLEDAFDDNSDDVDEDEIREEENQSCPSQNVRQVPASRPFD